MKIRVELEVELSDKRYNRDNKTDIDLLFNDIFVGHEISLWSYYLNEHISNNIKVIKAELYGN